MSWESTKLLQVKQNQFDVTVEHVLEMLFQHQIFCLTIFLELRWVKPDGSSVAWIEAGSYGKATDS